MPEITRNDVMLLFVMALAIVSMSLVFPALGITDEDSVSSDDIPTFELDEDRFDIAGEFPNQPDTPTSGTMLYDDSGEETNTNQVWLEGGTGSGGYELVLLPNDDEAEIRINRWDDSGNVDEYDSTNVSNSTPTGTVSLDDYEVAVEITDAFDADDGYYEVTWELVEQPGDGPLSELSRWVAFIASTFYWIVQTSFEVILNITGMLYDVTSYFIGLLTWMTSTYTAVVTSSTGWVSVFLALPGIIFSAVLGKLVIIGISLLPTT